MSEVGRASRLAHRLHADQVDKAGHPYIAHPAGVVGFLVVSDRYLALPRKRRRAARAAAWLHDTIEDCGVSPADLMRAGISSDVVCQVMLLTHHPNEPRKDYLHRISRSRVATAVKFADILHNSLPDRLRLLDQATQERLIIKYHKDFATLTELERRR